MVETAMGNPEANIRLSKMRGKNDLGLSLSATMTTPIEKKIVEIFDEELDCSPTEKSYALNKAISRLTQLYKEQLEGVKQNRYVHVQEILWDFANWMYHKGYLDADYYAEEPKAIDAYLASKPQVLSTLKD